MEAFLNLLWVLIAAVALGIWRTCWRRDGSEAKREPLREWTAMGCALVLLFFAVSLTDDLHSEVILFDECSTSRRCTVCAPHASQPARGVHTEIAILPSLPTFPVPERTGLVVPGWLSSETPIPRKGGWDRAPPSSSL